MGVYWALEYDTLMLFSYSKQYEIKVYTFFLPGYLKVQFLKGTYNLSS